MRRTFSLAVGLTCLTLLTGGAWGAPAGGDSDRHSAGTRIQVGTTESVSRLLNYRENRTVLRYPGADYVKVHLNYLALLPGDYVTVADPSGLESTDYRDGNRWAMSITGDTAVVTLHSAVPDPLGLRGTLSELGVGVDKVARGFTPAERAARTRRDPESICGGDQKADAVCYRSKNPIMFARSRAVARLLINGTELCTGWRIGAHNRMLTNHHCFTTSDEAYNTEVWFNYRCAVCGGFGVVRPSKSWGDEVLATDQVLDFTLFTLEDFSAADGFGYLELDNRAPQAGEEVYIPQHPGGVPTMIATSSDSDPSGNCQIHDPAYDGYGTDTDASYYCDTEGGSSGSPVISRTTNKVIALHHFGGCPNSGIRADLLYRKIGSLL